MLGAGGHDLSLFTAADELQRALLRDTFDAVVVDKALPVTGGLAMVAWAAETLEAPPPVVIALPGDNKADMVRSLRSGASDVVAATDPGEIVVARIEAAARRARSSVPTERLRTLGPYVVDLLAESIALNDKPVKLTSKEFALARLFFDNLNRPLSRAYLFAHVWGPDYGVDTRTLDMHISRLRSKLVLSPDSGFALQTLFGFGYRMDAFDAEGRRIE
ncbi:hypothetical protein AAW00_00150 [Aurantiacibacter luteus]|uniref:Transcriptional regulator n=1 Tax=Aurantiacibacter luteus TaxID=1581420 RepID=A0A0G9MZG7_9SPHN|nr:hypothetical protein AAW00_00150 [Aurantiacibacter luteus]